MSGALPFSAVVGQDDAKLALVLAAAQPRLGGVLLRGQKGSAKTTLARGLAALLAEGAPFVELPLGATEDRVLGSIDLAALLNDGTPRFRPGLLAAADGGVLYVDEINLLADHLIDSLLDVAVSGVNRVERDGVSHTHPARFVLVGSMNPEEGELRSQLLDRFGLAVDVRASDDPAERAEVVRRQLANEGSFVDPAHSAADQELQARIAGLRIAVVPDDVIVLAAGVALSVGAEGMRADLMLCRAAAVLAGWEGRMTATDDDLRRVAPFVLGHRRRRLPFDKPGISEPELDDAFDEAHEHRSAPDDPRTDDPGADDQRADDHHRTREEVIAPDASGSAPLRLSAPRSTASSAGNRSLATVPSGRFVRDRPFEDGAPVAPIPTAVAAATRRATEGVASGSVRRSDLRSAVAERKTGNLIVFVVDTSGSMGADRRIGAAKAAVLGLLADAYQRRDRVALVAFRGEDAEVVLRPTGSVEIARARLTDLPTGGTTPLAAALRTALSVASGSTGDQQLVPLLVVITDGRATHGGADPLAESQAAAEAIRQAAIPCVVVDAEQGTPRLGLAAELAGHLGGECIALDSLRAGPSDGRLEQTVRARLSRSNVR